MASLAELARREPDNPQRLIAYSEGLNQLGELRQQTGNLASAEAAWRQALALDARAHALQPGQATLKEWVTAQMNLAIFLDEMDRSAEALTLLEDVHPRAVQAAQAEPSEWHTVGILRGSIAEAKYSLGDFSEAIDTLQTSLDALAQVPGAADNRRVQLTRGRTLGRMAGVQLTTGQLDAAVTTYRETVRTDAELARLDPANLDYASTLLKSRIFLIEALAWAGKKVEAQSEMRRAEQEVQPLLARADAPLKWRMVHPAMLLLRRVLLTPGDEQLPAALQAFVDNFSGANAKNLEFTLVQRRLLARVALQLGDTLALHGQRAKAKDAWRKALAMLEGPAEGRESKGSSLLALAQVHWRLGNQEQARVLFKALDNSGFRLHPETVAFRREMQRAKDAGSA